MTQVADMGGGAALEQAALVETFDPKALAGGEDAVDGAVLGRLAEVSEEVAESGGIRWRVRSDARQGLLADIARAGHVEEALRRRGPADQDFFALYLGMALSGRRLPSAVFADDERRQKALIANEVAAASLAGLEALSATRDVVAANIARLRSRSSVEAERSRLRAILPGPLLGRGRERSALEGFISTGQVPAGFDLGPPARPEVLIRPFLVTGIAGAGKSALLADVIRRRRRDDCKGLPVALLDFDRASIARGGAGEWYSELTRQLGLKSPELAEAMRLVRAEARGAAPATSAQQTSISRALLADAIRERLLQALAAQDAAGQSLLVVIDTFEEVLTRSDLATPGGAGNTLFGQVLRWAAELADIKEGAAAAFETVRIVVCGRSTPALGAALGDWFCGHMPVADLKPRHAAAFLKSRDTEGRLTDAQARRAVDVVGGNPLTLILLERFARNQSHETIDEVLALADVGRILGGEEAARALYTRFLQRLQVEVKPGDPVDPEKLRRVAHPGLVLREVTPQLLQEIIAPGCGLQLSDAEAAALFRKLTEQVWLVEPIPGRPDAVRHRPDVRRLMLPMMNGAAVEEAGVDPRQVRGVRKQAVDWFGARSTTPGDEAAVEAAYHRAFLGDLEPLVGQAALCQSVWNLSPEDVSAMPPPSAALIRYYGRGAASLSAEQAATLPAQLRREALTKRTQVHLTAGQFSEAASSAESLATTPPAARPGPGRAADIGADGAPDPASPPTPTIHILAQDQGLAAEVNAAFLTGAFDKAARIGWGALVGMSDNSSWWEPLGVGDRSITDHWIWRAALARMVSPQETPDEGWLTDTFTRLLQPPTSQRYRLESSGVVLAAAAFVALRGRAAPLAPAAVTALQRVLQGEKFIERPGAARLLTLAMGWAGNDAQSAGIQISRSVFAPASRRFRDGDFALRESIQLMDLLSSDQAGGFGLLNERLPELEEVALAVIPKAVETDPGCLLDAVEKTAQQTDDWPPSVRGAGLAEQLGPARDIGRVLASVISTANLHGLLPDLLAAIDPSGPQSAALQKLTEVSKTYRAILSTPAVPG